MLISLYDFLDLSMDDYYKINIFDIEKGEEILHQIEVGNIEKELEKINREELLTHTIGSWDINEENENQFTLNID